jgi:hypothetical protein
MRGKQSSRGATGREPSLKTRLSKTPTPSKTPRSTPEATAIWNADLGPLRAARQPPVRKPEMIEFHASSFCRTPLTAQSNVLNIPPQTPKFPPVTGARAFTEERAPTRRSPYASSTCQHLESKPCHRECGHTRGELRAPLTEYQIVPPTAPIANAPPKSLRMTHGLVMRHLRQQTPQYAR